MLKSISKFLFLKLAAWFPSYEGFSQESPLKKPSKRA